MPMVQPDEMIIGGYEEEEQQPDPFVALSYSSKEEMTAAIRGIYEQGGVEETEAKDLALEIASAPSGDLFVKVRTTSGETICQAEVWKDEMWSIFSAYYDQVGRVLLMFAVEGILEPRPFFVISRERVSIDVAK